MNLSPLFTGARVRLGAFSPEDAQAFSRWYQDSEFTRHLAPRRAQRGEPAGSRVYAGRPILVTRNDYTNGLFNGDVGVFAEAPGLDGELPSLKACFPAADGTERWLGAGRLPEHETVYAMTVHKSQGSEVDEVAVVLPPRPSPVCTRELLYTAVTRAKKRVVVYGSAATVRATIRAKVQRSSGLRDRLWG